MDDAGAPVTDLSLHDAATAFAPHRDCPGGPGWVRAIWDLAHIPLCNRCSVTAGMPCAGICGEGVHLARFRRLMARGLIGGTDLDAVTAVADGCQVVLMTGLASVPAASK